MKFSSSICKILDSCFLYLNILSLLLHCLSAGLIFFPQSDLVFAPGYPDFFFFFKVQKCSLTVSHCGLIFPVVNWLLNFIFLICKMENSGNLKRVDLKTS